METSEILKVLVAPLSTAFLLGNFYLYQIVLSKEYPARFRQFKLALSKHLNGKFSSLASALKKNKKKSLEERIAMIERELEIFYSVPQFQKDFDYVINYSKGIYVLFASR